ncbi:hypothetical protein RclHR1_07110001 [Rhizophagus clarus]|uniref:BTB/POZ domain-containing protein n=1 Tax=Rhizophagus clarus TaxID=94130 RepID=A0A2Z6RV06_9GLOM|nr:hypothetical protein RclHR1_07110001 [Rhizophagus clarus]GES77401.1 BTB/POZ domain-containing protein [Rhizophagus clarus]
MELDINTFEDLSYLLHEKTNFDVKIKVGKENDIEEIQAHSTVLSSRSSHFQIALSNQINESGLFILEKPNISPSIFRIILKYIYSGKLTLKKNVNYFYVIIAAYDLQLKDVVECLETYLKENDSAWKLPKDFFIISEHNQLKQLEDQALKLACINPRIIFRSKDFLRLNERFLIQLLKRDDLEMNEIEIFNYLIKWGIANTNPKLNKVEKYICFKEMNLNINTKKWTAIDFMNMEKVLRNCIPHIRFFQMSPENYKLVQDKFKDILPNGLDEEVTQYFKDYNPLVKILSNENILPPRGSVYEFDSNIINAKDAALIASWIDGIDNRCNKRFKRKYQFKDIPFKFECIYRGSVDGFDNYYYEKNLFKYNRVVVLIKVRDSEEIIGAYNPFGWGINYGSYIRFKLFKDIVSRYFIFSLTNRANPILSYHKKGILSKISNDGRILFGKTDLSVNGIYCTSEQDSYKKKIIDKESFELAELEVFHVTNKNIYTTLRRNLLFIMGIVILFRISIYFTEVIVYYSVYKANNWPCKSAFNYCDSK